MEKLRATIVFIVMATFVVGQIVCMTLATLGILGLVAFQIMLVTSSSVLMVVWIISSAVIYFQLAGTPYKSDDHYRKARWLGYICAGWTVAFAIKFTACFLGDNIYDIKVNKESGFLAAAYFAGYALITEILPLFLVVDGNFVKIFSCEHLEDSNQDTSLLIGHLSGDTI